MGTRVWLWERVAGVLAAGLVTLIFLAGGCERIELITYDWRMRWFAEPPSPRIVIVAIDNPSLKELATWPWPRAVYARAIRTLSAAGAGVIGVDIDFSTLREPRDDHELARAVKESGRVVLAAFHEQRELAGGAVIEYANLPYPELQASAQGVGSINLPVDSDGALRRAPVTADVLGDRGWSFAVEVARTFRGAKSQEVRVSEDGRLWMKDAAVRLGDTLNSYIRFFGGPSTFQVVSFADVLEGRVDPALFAGKIVLIGATSLELQDLRHTPFGGLMPGVEIQANAIETVLAGRGYSRTRAALVLGGIAAILGTWTLALVALGVWRQRDTARRLRALGALGAVSLCTVVGLALSQFRGLVFLDVTPLMATAAAQVATSLIAGYWLAERRVEFQSENLLALYRMSEVGRHHTTLERIADLFFTQTQHLFGVDLLGMDLWDESAHQFRTRVMKDAGGFRPPPPLAAYEEVLNRVVTRGLPVWAADLSDALRADGGRGPRLRSSLFLPMVAQNRTIGGLHVHRVRTLPFSEGEVKTLLTLTTQVAFHIENGHLLEEVRALFQRSLEAFSTALDFKDNETGGHSQRVVAYTLEVGRQLGVSGPDLDVISQGARLHDIGKIAVPDRVLLKPGKLSDEEWIIMRKHPETGYQMLKTIQIPEPIATIVRHHHERFDGAGYPLGLRGNQIALGARIFSVADLYDAMSSDRPYRKALPMDRVIAELTHASGTQLDPDVVRAFFAIPPSVLAQVRTATQDGLLNRRIA